MKESKQYMTLHSHLSLQPPQHTITSTVMIVRMTENAGHASYYTCCHLVSWLDYTTYDDEAELLSISLYGLLSHEGIWQLTM